MDPESRHEPARTTYNILFVCTGNTCRSPMAEAVAREELARREWRHVEVASAGVGALDGDSASEHAVAVLEERGVDLRGHRSRLLTPELIEWADLILAMSGSHLGPIARMGGEDKMSLLGDFAAGGPGSGNSVRDPYGGELRDYQEAERQISRLVSDALERLAPILHP